MRSIYRLKNGVTAAALLAASVMLVMAAPAGAAADRDAAFQGHFAPHGGPVAHGGMHFGGAPRFGGSPAQMRFAAGPRYEGHFAGDQRGWGHGGDQHAFAGGRGEGGHWQGHARYAVPSHWVGMHPHWEGPHAGAWVRPWGPRWTPHYWGGGYWHGGFWPHVYLGWDFPWFLAALPFGCATYWWGGIPYYYWQGVYYVWSPDYAEYVVTDPPPVTGGTPEGAAAPPAGQAAAAGASQQGALSLYVYPKNGQSQQQTANDRYQCHQWAVSQTGFDPVNPANDTHAATATPSNYKRAVTACLDARGYSVQ